MEVSEPREHELQDLLKLYELARYRDAEVCATELISRFPNNGFCWMVLGLALKQSGRPEEGVLALRKAVQFAPTQSQVQNNLGVLLMEQGRLDEAAERYRLAINLSPDFMEARMNLGVVLHMIVGRETGEMITASIDPHQGVRNQYENLPFPSRDPEADRFVIMVSLPDTLSKINQYCFQGARDFSQPFRVLVAGCGTGDSVIWLAHQLRNFPASIVAIDISGASLEIAQARARVHGFDGIQWIHGSLLDLPGMDVGSFDYITCLGVLHHLPDPVLGLKALETVLADSGAMAVMLYGAVGRQHIYQMQNILRKLTQGVIHSAERLAFARDVVANLSNTNLFRKVEGPERINRQFLLNNINFWDTLLHEQDRAYTASQVREFLDSAGLRLQNYVSYQGIGAISSLQYDLDLYLRDPAQKKYLKSLPFGEREDLAEALDGSIALHTVYATRSGDTSLDPTSPNAILSPMAYSSSRILEHVSQSEESVTIVLSNGLTINYQPSALTRTFLSNVNGQYSNSDIFRLLGVNSGSKDYLQIASELRVPIALHWVLARTKLGTSLPPLPDLSQVSFPQLHFEPQTLPR